MAGPSTATPPPRTQGPGLPPTRGFTHWLHEGAGFAVARVVSDLVMLTIALLLARELTPEAENDFFVFAFPVLTMLIIGWPLVRGVYLSLTERDDESVPS